MENNNSSIKQIEIQKRKQFLQLHEKLGDNLLTDIHNQIILLNQLHQKEVLSIIGSYQPKFFNDILSSSEFHLNLKTLPVEVIYRIWRYLNDVDSSIETKLPPIPNVF
ncbi:Uncharacterized protein QTN25_006279 [Entamoeba marina]